MSPPSSENAVRALPLERKNALAAAFRGGGLGISFAVQLVLATSLSAEDYGRMAVGLSLVMIWSVVGTFGLDTLASREIGSRPDDCEYPGGWWAAALRRVFRLSPWPIAGCIATAILLSTISDTFSVTVILALCLTIPGTVSIRITEGAARGSRRPFQASIWSATATPSIWLLSLLVLEATGSPLTISYAIVARVFAVLLVAIIGASRYRRTAACMTPHGFSERVPVKISSGLAVLSILALGATQLDTILAAAALEPSNAGSYTLASRLVSGMAVILFGVNLLAAPDIAAGFRRQRLRELQSRLSALTRRALIISLVTGPILGVVIVAVIAHLKGGFVADIGAVALLIAAQISSIAYGPVGTALTMTSDEWTAVRHLGWSVALQTTVTLSLAMIWGQTGVALGTLCGVLLWNGLMARRVEAQLSIRVSAWGTRDDG